MYIFSFRLMLHPDSHQFMQKTIHNVVVGRHSSHQSHSHRLDTQKEQKTVHRQSQKCIDLVEFDDRMCAVVLRPKSIFFLFDHSADRKSCFFYFRVSSPCRNGATETVIPLHSRVGIGIIIIMTMVRTIRCASRSENAPRVRDRGRESRSNLTRIRMD